MNPGLILRTSCQVISLNTTTVPSIEVLNSINGYCMQQHFLKNEAFSLVGQTKFKGAN